MKVLKFREPLEMRQSGVGDGTAADIELGKFVQSREMRKPAPESES